MTTDNVNSLLDLKWSPTELQNILQHHQVNQTVSTFGLIKVMLRRNGDIFVTAGANGTGEQQSLWEFLHRTDFNKELREAWGLPE